MSGVRAPYIQRRGGVYHLRIRVPDAIRLHVGKTEIVRSLRTASFRLARPRAALLTALVMEAFEMINNTEMTTHDARKLVQDCFVHVIAEQQSQGGFIPVTDELDREIAEQQVLAEDRMTALREQVATSFFEPGVRQRVFDLLARNGISYLDLPEARRVDLANGVARALIEQQSLFILRLEDRFADYSPSDPLFTSGALHSSMKGAAHAGELQVYQGPALGHAVQSYLDAQKKVWKYRTHKARVWQLAYLVEYLGAARPIASIKSDDIRRYRNAVLTLRANHGFAPAQTFMQKQTDNALARI